MPDFDPDLPTKEEVLRVLSAVHAVVRRGLDSLDAARAFVSWDATGNKDIAHAFQFALAMLGTDCTHEWVAIDNFVFSVVRLLPEFKELEMPHAACGVVHVGHLRYMPVFLVPQPLLGANEFVVGYRGTIARGSAIGMPQGGGPPRQQDDPEPWEEADEGLPMDAMDEEEPEPRPRRVGELIRERLARMTRRNEKQELKFEVPEEFLEDEEH